MCVATCVCERERVCEYFVIHGYVHVCAAPSLKSLPHKVSVVSEEIDDMSAGSTDGPEYVERAELLDGVPLTSIDASLADEM